jgi:hypothetical protein
LQVFKLKNDILWENMGGLFGYGGIDEGKEIPGQSSWIARRSTQAVTSTRLPYI